MAILFHSIPHHGYLFPSEWMVPMASKLIYNIQMAFVEETIAETPSEAKENLCRKHNNSSFYIQVQVLVHKVFLHYIFDFF